MHPFLWSKWRNLRWSGINQSVMNWPVMNRPQDEPTVLNRPVMNWPVMKRPGINSLSLTAMNQDNYHLTEPHTLCLCGKHWVSLVRRHSPEITQYSIHYTIIHLGVASSIYVHLTGWHEWYHPTCGLEGNEFPYWMLRPTQPSIPPG